MTTTSIAYGTPATLNCTLASLVSSDSRTGAGQQSDVVDNSSTLYDDFLVGGQIAQPGVWQITTATVLEIWAFGSYDGTTFPAGLGTTDAAISIPYWSRFDSMNLITMIFVDRATMNAKGGNTFVWGPFSLLNVFKGLLPIKWGIFILSMDSGSTTTLGASGHELKYTPITLTGA